MSVFSTEKLTTEINTIMNKSDELMESLNTSPITSTSRKSILKTSSNSFKEIETEAETLHKFLNQSSQSDLIPRPHTLQDFVQKESLTENCDLKPTFTISELDEDEEIWVMDIPGTIDPLQLKGQVLQLGDTSKFKVGEDRYCAINRDCKSSLTCVFNTDKKSRVHKTVNIKPAGTISIRRKLSGTSKKKIEFEKSGGVPYPKNIKVRHPFLGVHIDSSAVKTEQKC